MGDRGQIDIKLGTKHVIYQKLAKFMKKSIFMLIGLKESSLVRKCVFYRPEHSAKGKAMELNFKGLEMEKWNYERIEL